MTSVLGCVTVIVTPEISLDRPSSTTLTSLRAVLLLLIRCFYCTSYIFLMKEDKTSQQHAKVTPIRHNFSSNVSFALNSNLGCLKRHTFQVSSPSLVRV